MKVLLLREVLLVALIEDFLSFLVVHRMLLILFFIDTFGEDRGGFCRGERR